jgi:peptidoglycan/xylan/chitin deacetylase (PgdA/CDA1 family)
MNPICLFFRNDDVRGSLDKSLVRLTDIFVERKISISHAVEPANISTEVAQWLLAMKNRYPKYIDIIQHGYDHNLRNPLSKYEFGADRSFESQLDDILRGKMIMNSLFGEKWVPIFTFPYGSYNSDTLKALKTLNYLGICTGTSFRFRTRVLNLLGNILKVDSLAKKRISYHRRGVNNWGLEEISCSINMIKKYHDEYHAVHYSLADLLERLHINQKFTSRVGILFHHRFHDEQLDMIICLLDELIRRGYCFCSIYSLLTKK